MMRLAAVFLSALALLCSCGGRVVSSMQEGGDTIPLKYAKLLTMVRYADHTHVSIKDPWQQGKVLEEYDVYQPFRRAVVFTSPHCQLLCDLQAEDCIKGVCDLQYMLIPEIQSRVAGGRIIDCGNAFSPMTEKIVEVKADALIISPFENSGGNGKLERLGIPIIEAADYMEASPLGRAEWMKFYGLLFGRERQADSLFHVVDSTYRACQAYAESLPKGRSILTERKTGSVWYTPGGRSTVGQLIRDAHGGYAFAADDHAGSLALPFEQVLDKAGDTEVWAFKYNGTRPLTKADLLEEYHGYRGLKAFRDGEIYECNTSTIPYFETVAFRPDLLLQEFIQLLHPGVNLGGLRYYKKLE